MLPGWAPYAIIAAVAIALIAVTVVLARLTWRRQVRRFIVDLVGRRESLGAALKTVDAAVAGLAGGTVAQLLAFADASSDDRRALAEIASRMRMEAAELADLALPKVLWGLADALGLAAAGLATEAGRVGDGEGEAVLDALMTLDLAPMRAALADADSQIVALSTSYDLTDPAVYGGGLYI